MRSRRRRWRSPHTGGGAGGCSTASRGPSRSSSTTPASGLTLAGVDPCCVLPLYATVAGGDVLIASEAKAFLEHPAFKPRLDREAVGELLCFGQPLGGKPLFAGVRGLPHGAHFEVDAGGDITVIRHWDVRRLPPPSLHGAAYLDRLEEAFRELAAEAYDDPGVLLPLTGGLDSRLFAAAAPPDRGVSTLTFGSPEDHDCALAARVAAARGLPHSVSPLEPAYVATYGPEAVWLLEGRLSPVGNITGSLMDRLRPATAFISGAGAAAGRHFWRSRMLVPDWAWDHAADGEFERLFTSRVMQFGLPMSSIPDLLVDGSELQGRRRGRARAHPRVHPRQTRRGPAGPVRRAGGRALRPDGSHDRRPVGPGARPAAHASLGRGDARRRAGGARRRPRARPPRHASRRTRGGRALVAHASPAAGQRAGAARAPGRGHGHAAAPGAAVRWGRRGARRRAGEPAPRRPASPLPPRRPQGRLAARSFAVLRRGRPAVAASRRPRRVPPRRRPAARGGAHGRRTAELAARPLLQVELWQRLFEDGDPPPVVRRS